MIQLGERKEEQSREEKCKLLAKSAQKIAASEVKDSSCMII